MTRFFLTLVMIISSSFVLTGMEPCNKHRFDISSIREAARNCFLESHKSGGKFFRPCFVSTPEDFAYELFRWRKTYSEFSTVFNEFLCICQPKGIDILYGGYSQVGDLFFDLYNTCLELHSDPSAHYEKGKIYFDRSQYGDCLAEIHLFTSSEEQKKEEECAEFLLLQGKALVEAKQFSRAIDVLTKFVELDSSNKEAHLYLALAWFETGFVDHAINDYLASGKSKNPSKVKLLVSREFKDGLLSGIEKGISEAGNVFTPSLLHSPYAMEIPLWILGKQPVNYTTNFCNVCGLMAKMASEYFKTIISHITQEDYAEEIILLCEKFDSLSDTEKGNLMGYSLGKYGIDIFSGGNSLKMITTFKWLKEANRLCNLEALALSIKNKEMIMAFDPEHFSKRELFFKNIQINWDKQNRYAANYEEEALLLKFPYAQDLLAKSAGKGIPVRNQIPGDLTYKECVDFGEFIGYAVDPTTNVITPTTCGEIHYSFSGACIIPVLAASNALKHNDKVLYFWSHDDIRNRFN